MTRCEFERYAEKWNRKNIEDNLEWKESREKRNSQAPELEVVIVGGETKSKKCVKAILYYARKHSWLALSLG